MWKCYSKRCKLDWFQLCRVLCKNWQQTIPSNIFIKIAHKAFVGSYSAEIGKSRENAKAQMSTGANQRHVKCLYAQVRHGCLDFAHTKFSEQTCPYFAHWVNKRQLECLYAVRRHQCLTCANRHFMFAFDLHICALAFLRLFPIFCTVAAHKCLVPVWAIYRHFCPLFSIFVCRFSICVG